MQMSDNGKRLLSEWEGFELNVYRDVAGLPTIGVGHLLTKDELSSGKLFIKGVAIQYGAGLSQQLVLDLLAQDLQGFETGITESVKVPLSQNEFDALVAFAFNIGLMAFKESTLLKELNQGQLQDVPAQLRRWIHSGGQVSRGMVNRREKEVALWNSDGAIARKATTP
jgi:lysozyme